MRIVEEKVYNFDELNDDIKEKLIEERKQGEFDCYMEFEFHEDMRLFAQDLVTDFFSKASIFDNTYYSLSYCQGDGAMIEFTTYTSVINEVLKGSLTYEEVKMIESYGDTIKVRHNKGHYYHERSFIIDYESDYSYYTDENVDELAMKIDKLMGVFEKEIIKMNEGLTEYGYSLQNYEHDMDFILEDLRSIEYYDNGEPYEGGC